MSLVFGPAGPILMTAAFSPQFDSERIVNNIKTALKGFIFIFIC